MNHKRWFAFALLVPVVGLLWGTKSAASWRPHLFAQQNHVSKIQFSRKTRFLVAFDHYAPNKFQIWDVATQELQRKANGRFLQFSPDERFMVVLRHYAPANWRNSYPKNFKGIKIDVMNIQTGEIKCSLSDYAPRVGTVYNQSREEIIGCNFSQDGQVISIATRSGLRSWNIATGKMNKFIKWTVRNGIVKKWFTAVTLDNAQFSMDGLTMASEKGVFDLTTGRKSENHTNDLWWSQFDLLSPDFYSVSKAGPLTYSYLPIPFTGIRIADKHTLWSSKCAPLYSSDAKEVFTFNDNGIEVLDAHTGVKLRVLNNPKIDFTKSLTGDFAPSPDGNWLYEARDGKIWKWRAR